MFADRPIFEIRSNDPMKAMATADALTIVEKTSLFGTAVHAVVRAGTASADAELQRAMAAAGIALDGIEPVVPSLDDVFLDVVDRA